MYQHMILMCSDYNRQRRIAFHKSYDNVSSIIKFQKIIELFKDEFKNVAFSFHHIITSSSTSESVVEYDEYFRNVKFYSDLDKFKSNVIQSIKVTPDDIVKYLLTKKDFDQLQIQKLLFLVYSEYMKEQDEPLFRGNFEVWDYGPVLPMMYRNLSKYGEEKIQLKDKELEKIKIGLKLSKRYDKDSILSCIDKVIDKYGNKTGGELIDLTHKKGSPWDRAKKEYGYNSEIPLEFIIEYSRSNEAY